MILGTLKKVSDSNGIYFDRDTETEDDSDIEIVGERKPTGWAYVGSHNFTMAAWGSFMEKSTPFTPIFSVSAPAYSSNVTCSPKPRWLTTSWVSWFHCIARRMQTLLFAGNDHLQAMQRIVANHGWDYFHLSSRNVLTLALRFKASRFTFRTSSTRLFNCSYQLYKHPSIYPNRYHFRRPQDPCSVNEWMYVHVLQCQDHPCQVSVNIPVWFLTLLLARKWGECWGRTPKARRRSRLVSSWRTPTY